jgi:hypothetical protein
MLQRTLLVALLVACHPDAGRDGQTTFEFSFYFQFDVQRLQWRLPKS